MRTWRHRDGIASTEGDLFILSFHNVISLDAFCRFNIDMGVVLGLGD